MPSSCVVAGQGGAGFTGAVGVLDFSDTAAAGHQSEAEHACAQNEGDLSANHHVELRLVFTRIPNVMAMSRRRYNKQGTDVQSLAQRWCRRCCGRSEVDAVKEDGQEPELVLLPD